MTRVPKKKVKRGIELKIKHQDRLQRDSFWGDKSRPFGTTPSIERDLARGIKIGGLDSPVKYDPKRPRKPNPKKTSRNLKGRNNSQRRRRK